MDVGFKPRVIFLTITPRIPVRNDAQIPLTCSAFPIFKTSSWVPPLKNQVSNTNKAQNEKDCKELIHETSL